MKKTESTIAKKAHFQAPDIKRIDLAAKSKGLRPVFMTQYECVCGNEGTSGWSDSYSDAWGYYP
jgi:hypothetical protein